MVLKATFSRGVREFGYRYVWFYRLGLTLRALIILGLLKRIRWYHCRRFQRGRKLITNSYALCSEFDTTVAVDEIKTKGYSVCTNLAPRCIEGILEFCSKNDEISYYNPHMYCSLLHDICYNEKIVSVARNYLGAEPIVMGSKLWWVLPPSCEHQEMTPFSPAVSAYKDNAFHFDIIDFKSLTFFVYLTDVDRHTAPHVLIERTAQERDLGKLLNRIITDDEASRKYGDRILTILGPKGTAFFEDLSSYHKVAVAEEPRLAFRINYTVQRRPFRAPRKSLRRHNTTTPV